MDDQECYAYQVARIIEHMNAHLLEVTDTARQVKMLDGLLALRQLFDKLCEYHTHCVQCHFPEAQDYFFNKYH